MNAAVLGILVAALCSPLWTGSVAGPGDVAVVAIALLALVRLRSPPIVVVAFVAVAGQLLATVG